MDIKNVQNQKVKILFQIEKHDFFSTRVGKLFSTFFKKNRKSPTSCRAQALGTL